MSKHQCEYCDEEFDHEPVVDPDSRTGNRTYCSCDCHADAVEDFGVGDREAQREFEVYGDDYDSWYR